MHKHIGRELDRLEDHILTSSEAKVRVTINGLRPIIKKTIIVFANGEELKVNLVHERLKGHCLQCNSLSHDLSHCSSNKSSVSATNETLQQFKPQSQTSLTSSSSKALVSTRMESREGLQSEGTSAQFIRKQNHSYMVRRKRNFETFTTNQKHVATRDLNASKNQKSHPSWWVPDSYSREERKSAKDRLTFHSESGSKQIRHDRESRDSQSRPSIPSQRAHAFDLMSPNTANSLHLAIPLLKPPSTVEKPRISSTTVHTGPHQTKIEARTGNRNLSSSKKYMMNREELSKLKVEGTGGSSRFSRRNHIDPVEKDFMKLISSPPVQPISNSAKLTLPAYFRRNFNK